MTELVKADNVVARWGAGFMSLPAVRQLGLLFGLAASVALGLAVVLWAQEPSYSILFGSLGEQEASQVIEVLQKRGIDYKVDSNTGAVLVPSAKVHEVRLQLAGDGLPKSSNQGFEFLNQQPQFGTSQFIQTARYQRALEEELARSITTIASVKGARVHLALPKQSVFVRERRKPSASVLLSLYPGRTLEISQVSAIAHLVASSVPELEADQVTVVDEIGRLLSGQQNRTENAAVTQEQFNHQQRVQANYVRRIEDILAPIVGLNGVRAQVNADLDFTVTEQTQESYNPDAPAIRSSQVSEEKRYGGGAEGIPGALSNQPPGPVSVPEKANVTTQDSGQTTPLNSRRNSTTNYELDRTISHTKLASGGVRRLSIAVVVDDKLVTGEGDRKGQWVRQPWSQQELDRLIALVKDAVGYDPRRGDTVNVINSAFTAPAIADIPPLPFWQRPWVQDYIKIGLAAMVMLLLVLAVLRPVLRGLAAGNSAVPALPGSTGAESLEPLGEDRLTLSGDQGQAVKLPGPGAYEQNIAMVRNVTREDPKLVANVVRTWVSND